MLKKNAEDPEHFYSELAAAAEEVGALVVDGLVQGNDNDAFPTVVLNGTIAAQVIRFAKPRIVYLAKLGFEIEAEISEATGRSGEEESNIISPAIGQLLRKWKRRNGEIGLVVASFVADSVLHTSVMVPDWKSEFNVELAQAEHEVNQSHVDARSSVEALGRQEIAEKAPVLAQHPSFNSGRVSFAKRMLLAEKLFPGLAEDKLANIVDRAQDMDWLKKAGFDD